MVFEYLPDLYLINMSICLIIVRKLLKWDTQDYNIYVTYICDITTYMTVYNVLTLV